MKYEPLNGKMEYWIANGRQHTIEKIKEDVNSAVKGFAKEIDCMNAGDCMILRCDVEHLVEKWFPDAIDNDTEEMVE